VPGPAAPARQRCGTHGTGPGKQRPQRGAAARLGEYWNTVLTELNLRGLDGAVLREITAACAANRLVSKLQPAEQELAAVANAALTDARQELEEGKLRTAEQELAVAALSSSLTDARQELGARHGSRTWTSESCRSCKPHCRKGSGV